MILVDIHAHLDHIKFKDNLDKVIDNARKAGVKAIITSGVNSATNKIALELQEKYLDIVKASFGLYPIDALAHELKIEADSFVRDVEELDVDQQLDWMEDNKDKCIAIGEVGLDYYWIKDKQQEMKFVFDKVIATVEKIKKPIIVHTRKAEQDCVDMLEASTIDPKKIVLHCFSGNKKLIKRAADNGWNFSIPPVITRLQHFQMMAELVNINQLLTETDAPYLSPYPDKINEPAYVAESIKKIAEIKKFEPEEVANNIFMNFQNIFTS
ncbi:TatD family hydrolase [Candidatus Woesearchaeota archaeon]|nr:TatD family hydrolase [Candidatus Woesearchaeota archaeon]